MQAVQLGLIFALLQGCEADCCMQHVDDFSQIAQSNHGFCKPSLAQPTQSQALYPICIKKEKKEENRAASLEQAGACKPEVGSAPRFQSCWIR
eukprot:1155018-Pelagomonas_calceolata.AAC.1